MTPDSSRLSSSPTRTGRRRCPPAGSSSPKRGVGGGRPRLDEDEEDRPLRRPQVGEVRTGNRQGGGAGAAAGAATGAAGRHRAADGSDRIKRETEEGGKGERNAILPKGERGRRLASKKPQQKQRQKQEKMRGGEEDLAVVWSR